MALTPRLDRQQGEQQEGQHGPKGRLGAVGLLGLQKQSCGGQQENITSDSQEPGLSLVYRSKARMMQE